MKFNRKLKALMMSLALLGLAAATPITTNAQTIQLHRGMQNQNVKPLQRQLKKLDYYHDSIDGDFGPFTYKAVEAFQKDHHLAVDGIVGPNTRQALNKVKTLKNTYQNAPLLMRGSHGKVVKDLQTQLKQLNYYNGNLDGIYGPLTEAAVKEFQQANHIAVDGIAGPNTYSALIDNPVAKTIENNDQTQKPAAKKKSTAKPKPVVESISTGPDQNSNTNQNVSRNANNGNVKTLYVTSTAYTANCPGCSGVTATGINLVQNPGAKVIAVDPSVIPLGSTVWVQGYGYAVAGDTGSAINGDRIDVFIPNRSKALQWGTRTVEVKVYPK